MKKPQTDYAARITQRAINETGSYELPVVIPKVLEIAEREAEERKRPFYVGTYLKAHYQIKTTGDIVAAIERIKKIGGV
jgi:hypothetical protein